MNEVVEKVESKFRWYSLKVISGKELLAKDNILFESESAIDMLKDSDEYKAASEDRQRELVGSITGFIDEILVTMELISCDLIASVTQ